MIVPVCAWTPPQPEIVCRVTSASPSATPPTTFRPRKTIIERLRFRGRAEDSIESSVEAAGQGRANAVRRAAEPRLDPGHGGQVVRLLRGVEGRDPRAGRQRVGDRRAG